MQKSIQITLIITTAVVLLALLGAYLYSSSTNGTTVSATGQATVKTTPDLVTVYYSVETKGTTAQDARDKNSEITDNLITALVKQGFNRDEIQTQSFNVYPNYNYATGRQTQDGFIATHSIKLEMSTSNTDKIGKAIDAGVDSGANLNYINFELSTEKQNELKAQALELAAQDARTRAEAVAQGLNKKIGKVVSVSASDFNYYPWNLYSSDSSRGGIAEAKSVTTNIQPSSQDVSASVSVVYEIK